MMNKKVIIILLILLVLIVMLVPMIVWARANLGIPIEKAVSKEEFENVREQEKIDWMNNQQKKNNIYSEKKNETIDQSMINTINEEEVYSEGKKIDEILCRFYKDKYTSLTAKIEENQNEMPLIELYSQPYAEELFELIIDVIKNKDISDEEREILKELLDLQYVLIKNPTMKTKFDEVLNNN